MDLVITVITLVIITLILITIMELGMALVMIQQCGLIIHLVWKELLMNLELLQEPQKMICNGLHGIPDFENCR